MSNLSEFTNEQFDDESASLFDRRRFLQAAGASAVAPAAAGVGSAANGYTTTDLTITSFDGVELAATLYEPDSSGEFPAILMTHGWGSDRNSGAVTNKAENYASNGYVVLAYDSRGFGDSGGEVGLDGPNEVQDVSTLIDWLAGRHNVQLEGTNDPVLGMDGYSYSGGIQLNAAAADDRIDALVPRMTWNDLTYAMAPHGVVKIGWLSLLLGIGGIKTWEFESGPGLDQRLWEWYLQAAWNNELPADARDAFEERSSAAYEIDRIDAPTLLIQGWDDTLFKPVEALRTYRDLQARGVDTRLVYYEGGHAIEEKFLTDSEKRYMNDLALDWMDKHLKGAATEVPQSVQYLKQPGVWRETDAFPPSGVSDVTLELSETEDSDHTYLEKDVWWWNDTSHLFDWRAGSDFEIVGAPTFELWVEPDGPEERLFFNFHHTDADGHTKMINDMGETYRVEGENQVQKIEIDFSPIQRFLEEGDLISLEISISDPFYFDSRESDGVYIHHSSTYPSQFTLPMQSVSGDQDVEKDLSVGDRVHVTIQDLAVRDGAGTGYGEKKTKKLYTSGEILDGPVQADGYTWWQVQYYEDDATVGWSIEKGLDRGARHSERLTVGDRVQVETGDDYSGLNVRTGPSLEYESVDVADDGAYGRVVSGPEWTNGWVWWEIDYDDHENGWSAQEYVHLV